MDCVLVKVKRLRSNPVFKLLSDKKLFETISLNLAVCVPYTPDHNLDEDSWFKIERFSEQKYCLPILVKPFDSKEYDDLEKKRFSDIAYICSVQGNDFYFQKVTPSLFLKRKMITFGEAAVVEDDEARLVVNEFPDAIYIKQNDTLVFRNLATISSIFPEIDELYREATQAEVEKFLENDFISLSNGFVGEKVSKPNRKRIALAMATLDALPPQDKAGMLTYINGYCGDRVKYDKAANTFEISDDDSLKLLIYGIEQRFYTTQFGQEKRLANSVQALG
ncbi:ATP F0F1 synthase synthase (plasmid) [Pseudomonas luteola]